MMNKLNSTGARVNIVELKDEQGNAKGTRVDLILPHNNFTFEKNHPKMYHILPSHPIKYKNIWQTRNHMFSIEGTV
jgi:hypothetical protein